METRFKAGLTAQLNPINKDTEGGIERLLNLEKFKGRISFLTDKTTVRNDEVYLLSGCP